MSERTPAMSTIRHAWVKAHPFPLTTDVEERYAEFNRWLADHDMDVRAQTLVQARWTRADIADVVVGLDYDELCRLSGAVESELGRRNLEARAANDEDGGGW